NHNIARGGAHLQHRTAAVQIAFCAGALRAILASLSTHLDFRKIRADPVAVGQLDRGSHGNIQIGNQIRGTGAGRALQQGLASITASDELRHNGPGTSFCSSRRHTVQFNTSAPGFCANWSLGRAQANAASTGLNLSWTPDLTQVDTSAPS